MWARPNACRALEDAFETYEDACGACELACGDGWDA